MLILGWVAMITTRPSGEFEDFVTAHKGITTLLLLFLAWTFLSVSWATSHSAVLTSLGRYVPNLVLFVLIYATADKRSHALAVIAMFVVGSSIAAAYGVLSPPNGYGADVGRTGGTFGDPNYLAAVLVTALVISFAIAAMRSLAPVLRVASLGAAVLCVAGILLSLSRGGLVALGVALLVSVAISGRWRMRMAIVTAVVALLSISYYAIYASPAARARLTQTDGGSGRSDIWMVGWRMVQAHPLDGVGAGNFRVVSARYLLQPGLTTHAQYFITTPAPAHNTYLEVLAEGGIPALALLLAIIGSSLRCLQKAWLGFRVSGDSEMELLTYAVFAGLAGFLCASFFLSEEYSKQLWLLLAFGPMLLHVSTLPPEGKTVRWRADARAAPRRAPLPVA